MLTPERHKEIVEFAAQARRLGLDRALVTRTARAVALMVETKDDPQAFERVRRLALESGLATVITRNGKRDYGLTEKGELYFMIAELDDEGIDVFSFGH